jgi:hypothetical protein
MSFTAQSAGLARPGSLLQVEAVAVIDDAE